MKRVGIRTLVAAAGVLAAWMVAPVAAAPKITAEAATPKITEAAPAKAQVAPAQPRKLLVFSVTGGFHHGSIPYGAKALEILGAKTGAYTAVVSDDLANFEADKIKQFDAIVFNNTSGSPLRGPRGGKQVSAEKEKQLIKNLLDYVRNGGGFVGIHAATDTYKKTEYSKMIGGAFAGHPWSARTTVAIKVDEPDNPINAAFGGKGFQIKDEIYQHIDDSYSRKTQRVLLSLETVDGAEKISGKKGARKDGDYGISWVKSYGKGRVFYCALGHNNEIFWNGPILQHMLAGIQYALGDLKLDAAAGGKPKPPAATGASPLQPADPKSADAYMGEYPGTFTPKTGKAVAAMVYLVPDGGGKYRAVLTAKTAKPMRVEAAGRAADGVVNISGEGWTGKIGDGRLSVAGPEGKFACKFTERTSPTLGAKPPAGAVVLVGAEGDAAPNLDAWTNTTWQALPGGIMQCGKRNNMTRQSFGSCTLHVEFRIPYEPTKRGQGRGNSGVYVQNRYEVQVLDSFGLVPQSNECGGIYKIATATAPASLPPLAWQTYDITFTAAKLGADGKVEKLPRMTVLHNGIKIHDNVELTHPTTAAGSRSHGGPGPLMLQDHGHPVWYRNIWLVETRD